MAPVIDQAGGSPEAEHLCVLVHGLWGNPNHLRSVAKCLREKHPTEKLHILIAKRNSGSFTYDGIELGGERVCQEIEEEIENLARQGQVIKRLSMVGYSLGGLVCRFAIGLLHSKGLFDKVEAVNFTTFASPHLGVRTPLRGYHNHIWNVLGARTLSMSGRQLFTIDKFRDTGRPLLSVLADPDSVFMQGLARFQRRTLYTNIVNDTSATYYTTGISKNDPFADVNNIKLNYLTGYEDIIIDPSDPVAAPDSKEGEGLPKFYARLAVPSPSKIGQPILMLAMMLFIPFGIVGFLINSLIQSVRSKRRIRLHEAGKAGIEVSAYRSVPLLINSMRETVEDVYENLNSAQSHEFLFAGEHGTADDADALLCDEPPMSPLIVTATNPFSKSTQSNGHSQTRKSKTKSESAVVEDEKSSAASVSGSEISTTSSAPRQLEAPTLALAPYQFAMIQALDGVGWRKYPVHIHKSNHSHAAIIVRMDKPSMDEGYVVLRHWLEEEFIL